MYHVCVTPSVPYIAQTHFKCNTDICLLVGLKGFTFPHINTVQSDLLAEPGGIQSNPIFTVLVIVCSRQGPPMFSRACTQHANNVCPLYLANELRFRNETLERGWQITDPFTHVLNVIDKLVYFYTYYNCMLYFH